jgi:hypothetical protein
MLATSVTWPVAFMNVGIALSLAGVLIAALVIIGKRATFRFGPQSPKMESPKPPKPVLWTTKTVTKCSRPWDSK